MAVTHQWHLKGEYLESCNCEVLCPPAAFRVRRNSLPKATVIWLWHSTSMKIDEGDFDGVSLGGLSFVVVMYTPGKR